MGFGIIRSAGRVTEIRVTKGYLPMALQRQLSGGKKREITEWSRQSRRNLIKSLMACDWAGVPGHPVMITLTYAEVQLDGRRCRRDLDVFRRAWAHQWGSPVGAWKEEFQERGAIHWHLVVVVSYAAVVGEGVLEIGWRDARGRVYTARDAQAWVLATWQRIVGPDTTIVEFSPWRGDRDSFAWYFGGYSAKKSKEYQNIAPEGSSGWGRRWGLWGIKPVWDVSEVDVRTAYRVRRVLRGLQHARSHRRRRAGSWYVHVGGSARVRFRGAFIP